MKEFNIDNFNIIQDEENYYFFRALNLADIEDLEKEIAGKDGIYNRIRTDRERWEQNPDIESSPRYTSVSKVSLQELHDHIKIHYRKDTNCISLSSNPSISICYGRGSYKDQYVLIRIPKKEFGNLTYNAGSYMLEEIEKIVEREIDTLKKWGLADILSVLSSLDRASSSEEITDIVTGLYKLSSEKERTFRGKKVSSDRLQAISKRFKRYSSLSDAQVLEKNRLIGKLTVLEHYNRLAPLIPHTRTSSQLLASVGNAFSSSEIIHYGDIPGEQITKISSTLMDMLSMMQQLKEKSFSEEDIQKISNMEGKIINLVIQGYTFEENGEELIFTNGQTRINLESLESIPEFKEVPVDEVYRLTNGQIPYAEFAEHLKKNYYILKSKLRANELARNLHKILGENPEYEDIIKRLQTTTYEIEPEIMSRVLENNYRISESVGIFLTDSERNLISEIEKLDLTALRRTILEDGIKSRIVEHFGESREKEDENSYYANALVSSYDWDRIGIVFTPEQKELFVEKLAKQNLPEAYKKLKTMGIEESKLPIILLNLCINSRFEEVLRLENFEKAILDTVKELTKNISIEQVENYLEFYRIEGTSIVLKEYQQRAVDNLDKILENKKFASVILPTGAGKTFVEIAEMLKPKYSGKKILCLAPSREILQQMQDYLVEYVIGRKGSLGKTNAEIVKEHFPNLELATYAGLKGKGTEELKNAKYDLIFLDELHRIGAENWGKNADTLLSSQEENTKIIGITATPVRDREKDASKNQKRNMADEVALKLGYTEEEIREGKHIAIKMDLIDAIRNGIVINLKTVSCEYTLKYNSRFTELLGEISQIDDEEARNRSLRKYNALRREIDNASGISEILQESLKKGRRYIVFMPVSTSSLYGDEDEVNLKKGKKVSTDFRCKKIKDQLAKWLGNEGLEFYSMFGSYSNKRNLNELHGFENSKTDNIKFMLVMNKLNEGVHVKGVNGIIWLRALDRDSAILLQQQMGRCIVAVDENHPLPEDEIPIIIDFPNNLMMVNLYNEVNTYSKLDDIEMLRDIRDWVEYHNGYLPDINSTGKEEVRKAITLKRIQAKYKKYLYESFDVLEESEKKRIEEIIALGEEFDLWNLILPDKIDENGKSISLEELTNIDVFKLTGKLRMLTELENEVRLERSRGGVVENVLKVARVLYENGVDLSKVQTCKRDENNKNYYYLLSEIPYSGDVNIEKIIAENNLDPNFEFGLGIRKVRDAYNGTSNLRITESSRKDAEKFGIVNPDPEKSVIAKTLKVARILHRAGVDLSIISLNRGIDGKTRPICLSEIQQEGIDINKIIEENDLDPRFEYGRGVIVLRATYNGTRKNKITESEKREAESLRLVKLEKNITVVERTLRVARILNAEGVNLEKIELGKKQDNGKFHYFLLSELSDQIQGLDEIISKYNLDSNFEFGSNCTKLRRAYRGTGTSAITESQKRESELLGLVKKENSTYQEVIEWLDRYNQMPRGSLGRNGVVITKREDMTEEEQRELNLYSRWRESRENKILIEYIGKPIEDVPEEYREKIKELRARGLGLQKKTLEEEMLEWLESHNGQMPRLVIYREGRKILVSEMSESEKEECRLRARWKNSKERKVISEYAGKTLEEVPKEYRGLVERFKNAVKSETAEKKVLEIARRSVVEQIANNSNVRTELGQELVLHNDNVPEN